MARVLSEKSSLMGVLEMATLLVRKSTGKLALRGKVSSPGLAPLSQQQSISEALDLEV